MKLKSCLGCYQPLDKGIYHPKCSKLIFGTLTPPKLDATVDEIEKVARSFLNERVAVPGVQRKLSLSLTNDGSGDGTKRLTIVGSLGGAYIMKPPTPDYQQLPENEDLSMHLAKACGIQTAVHGLLPMEDGTLAYVTKRFDRSGKKKVAVEDLCQLSELLTEQKYRSSYEQAGKIIRKFSSVPGDDALRFFESVVFSYVIGNNDMHLKNFTLVTEELNHIHLSPAYDLLAVRLILSKKEDPEEMALTINGKKNKLRRSDFETLASNLQISPKVCGMVLAKQIAAKPKMEEWIERSFLSRNQQTELKALIAESLAIISS